MNLLRRLFNKYPEQPVLRKATTLLNRVTLQIILLKLFQPGFTTDLSNRVKLCEQALTLVERAVNPALWAVLHGELGNGLAQSPVGIRAENLERALNAYKAALQIFTLQDMPGKWATTMSNLANIYLDRVHGNREENLEYAISSYEAALKVQTRHAKPYEWAQTTSNLANAYLERIRGDREENIEYAMSAYKAALQVLTMQASSVKWAGIMNNLANAYYSRIRGERERNLEQAISTYEKALLIRTRATMPDQWSTTMMGLANTYYFRIHGERDENLEHAIHAYKAALEVRTRQAMPIEWAQAMVGLANVYVERIRGDRAENLDYAIQSYAQVLQVHTRQTMPFEWAQTKENLANTYYLRIYGDRANNIERAIHAYKEVLEVHTRQNMSIQWAQTMGNLANAYMDRIHGNRAKNLECAIHTYTEVLQIQTPHDTPIEWSATMMNLGNAYRLRVCKDRAENLERAIQHYSKALQVHTREEMPAEWAMTMMNLGNAYWERIHGDREENLESAINAYEQALQVRTRQDMPVDWAQTMSNLANAYADRIRGNRAQNVEDAIAAYRQALAVRTQEAMPADHRQTQFNLGSLALEEQRWLQVVKAFQGALAAGDLLYSIASTPEARQAELREVDGLPAACAYAQARLSESDGTALTEAVVILERYRARWLAEGLALRSEKPMSVPDTLWNRFTEKAAKIQQLQAEAQLPDNTPSKRDFLTLSDLLAAVRTDLSQAIEEIRSFAPGFMPIPSFGDIQSAFATISNAPTEVGIYLLTTTQGGLALIVHAGNVIPIWLDALTNDMSQNLLHRWLEAYEAFRYEFEPAASRVWFDCIEATSQQLWDLAIDPIIAKLERLDLLSKDALHPPVVTLIRMGVLALLPLHASWTDDSTTPTGRRYFLDHYAVRYAPSATALHHCRERVSDVDVEFLLALDEPKPITGGGPLPNSSHEVKAIASLFPRSTVLQHDQAVYKTTHSALTAAQVAHFCCHGANNWRNPLDSGLLLANDQLLSVRDFLELHLPGARLATLSACETGLVGTDLPDEVIMLPSALVQAGYAGVVASLWSVADVSTAMLMVRFYQYWREEELEPVYALRAAQHWVRDTTNREKAAYFGQFVPGLLRMAEGVAVEFFTAAMLAEEGPDARSFAHPFWWGAFYLTGV